MPHVSLLRRGFFAQVYTGRIMLAPLTLAILLAIPQSTPAPASDTHPTVISTVEPQYTDDARTAKISGSVLVALIVDKQGNPTHVRVVHGLGHGLDEKALEAVRGYKFQPATMAGQSVAVNMNIEVNFQIF